MGNHNLGSVCLQFFSPYRCPSILSLSVDNDHSFVSIGCPGRPLATDDPSLDDLLPKDDAAWDQGVGRNVLNRSSCADENLDRGIR